MLQAFPRHLRPIRRRPPLPLRRKLSSSNSNLPATKQQQPPPTALKTTMKRKRKGKPLNTKRVWTVREQKLAFVRLNIRKKATWTETADDLLETAVSRLSWAQTKLLQHWNPRVHDRIQRLKNAQLTRINAKWWFWQIMVCISPCVVMMGYCELRGKHLMYDHYCQRTRSQMRAILGEEWTDRYADYILDQDQPLTLMERIEQFQNEMNMLYRGLILGEIPDEEVQIQITDAPRSMQQSMKELLESHETEKDDEALMKGLIAKMEDLEEKVENPTFLTKRANKVLQSDIGHRMEAKMVDEWMKLAEKMPPNYQKKVYRTPWQAVGKTMETVAAFVADQYRVLISNLSTNEGEAVLTNTGEVPPPILTQTTDEPLKTTNVEGDISEKKKRWWQKLWK